MCISVLMYNLPKRLAMQYATFQDPSSFHHNHSFGTALSDQSLSLSQASQSDLVVGSRPIPFTFQIPRANINMLHKM